MLRRSLICVAFLNAAYYTVGQLSSDDSSDPSEALQHQNTNQSSLPNLVVGLGNLFGFDINPNIVPPDVDEIARMNPDQVAEYWGYSAENFTAQTKDGYLLTVNHIWNPSVKSNGEVIFLQHGLFDSAFSWLVNLPSQSLAFLLADRGWDVWLGNFRGNTYSRAHIKYNPDLPGINPFWCFSFHELAIYDLPAMIDLVLNRTGVEQISYVGHSQGTTTPLILLSTFPEYNNIFKSLNFLAPIMNLQSTTCPLILLLEFYLEPLRLLRCTELLKNENFAVVVSEAVCGDKSVAQNVCTDGYEMILGPTDKHINETRLPIYLAHTPAGSSTGQVSHFIQFAITGIFAQYDFGMVENILRYGAPEPPLYEIEKITAPICLIYSDNDSLGDPDDVQDLIERLQIGGSLVCTHRIRTEEIRLNHQDFLWSIVAKDYVYDLLFSNLENYIGRTIAPSNQTNTQTGSSSSRCPLFIREFLPSFCLGW